MQGIPMFHFIIFSEVSSTGGSTAWSLVMTVHQRVHRARLLKNPVAGQFTNWNKGDVDLTTSWPMTAPKQ